MGTCSQTWLHLQCKTTNTEHTNVFLEETADNNKILVYVAEKYALFHRGLRPSSVYFSKQMSCNKVMPSPHDHMTAAREIEDNLLFPANVVCSKTKKPNAKVWITRNFGWHEHN